MGSRYMLLLSLLCFSLLGKAQTDTEFWFVVPEGSSGHSGTTYGEPVLLHLAALDAAATVTIDMPKNTAFTPTTFTIPANSTQKLDLTWYVRDNTSGILPPYDILTPFPGIGTAKEDNILESGLTATVGTIENKGIRIVSNALITAYLERNSKNNPDIWALKGKNAKGTDFYVPSQTWRPNGSYAPTPYNAVDVVATEDTYIYFNSPVDVWGYGLSSPPGGIYLQKGQSICLRATGTSAAAHLGGIHIWSDGDITVQWKDDSVAADLPAGCRDMNGDQMIPVDLAGNEYVVMRGQLTTSREHAWIISLQNGTIIDFADVDGFAPASITLGAPGTQIPILLNNGSFSDPAPAPTGTIDALHIKSRNGEPFLVYHVTGFGCEMGAAVLPTIKGCTGSTEVSFQRSTDEGFFLNIMTKEAHIDDFFITISGTNYPIPNSWFTEIPGTGVDATSDWWYLDKAYNDFGAAHTVGIHGADIPPVVTGAITRVYNTTGIFHLGLINGGTGTGCRYGYFSDFSDNYGSAFIPASGSDYIKYCYGDTIQLQATGGLSYLWENISTPFVDGTFIDPKTISSPRVKPPTGYHRYIVAISRACYLSPYQDTSIIVAAYGYPEITAAFDTTQIGCNNCSPYEMKYINQSVGANKWEWTFERVTDTLHYSIKDPEVVYFSNNNYTTKEVKTTLKVSYTNNCPDTVSKMIPIRPEITASATKGSKSGCQQDVTVPYTIDTTSAGPITSIYWNWGDGWELEVDVADLGLYTTDSIRFEHTFENLTNFDTSYYVTLVFIDDVNDCRDTLTPPYMDTVYVPGVARARFTVDDAAGCSPHTVNFDNRSNGLVSYLWDFGEGTTSTSGADTAIVYTNFTANPIDYNVVLTITKANDDSTSCYDTYLDTITVYPEFTTTINTSDPLEGCNPHTVDFSQTTVPAVATEYYWNFGNGSTSGNADPSAKLFQHFEPNDKTYTVSLITKSQYACADTATPKDVTVYAYVDALFTVSDTVGCSPLDVEVENVTSPNSVNNLNWNIPGNIGSDFESLIAPFTVVYQNTGDAPVVKTISLLNNNGHAGCDVSFERGITINPEITPEFTRLAGTDTVCDNTSVSFTNNSYFTGVPASTITAATPTASFLWNFGDGSTSTSENPVKVFKNTSGSTGTTPQKYVISLTLSVNGCTQVFTDSVYVKPVVKAQLNTPETRLCNGSVISLANNSVGAGNYLWEFSDGTPDVVRTDKSSVSFTASTTNVSDIQLIKVYLTASNGACSHTDSLILKVYPTVVPQIAPDIAAFCGPDTVSFSNTTLGGNATDNQLSYLWDFGDGSGSTASTVEHRFGNTSAADTIYTITLTATNPAGCTANTTTQVTVYPEVEARFTFIKNSECHPVNVFLDNNSMNGTLYQWDFGYNGETLNTVAHDFYKVFTHSNPDPNQPSTYTIWMKALDENHPQCSDSMSRQITIYPPVVPKFDISDGDVVCYPQPTEFTNSSTGYDLSYIWDYRDGNTSSALDPVHTHLFENRTAADKTYEVKLMVFDGNGCSATTTKDVVAHPRVIAGFTFKKDALDKCTPIPVEFSYPASALNGNKFTWNFGDGTPQENKITKDGFTHVFDNPNPNNPISYSISLRATDTTTSCYHDTTRSIRIFPRLVPRFDEDVLEGCNPLEVAFENQTTGMASYDWNFADNQTSIESDPVHVFTNLSLQNRDYNVVLTASQDSTGCVLTADTVITVYSYVKAVFGLQAAAQEGAKGGSKATLVGGCTPFDAVITDSSKVNGSKLWDFGHWFSIADSTATKHYLTYLNNDNNAPLEDTTYIIKLKLTNNEGCMDSTQQSLIVYPRPVADFTGDLAGCHPFTTNIVNQSEANNNYNYYWELSDGSTIVNENFTHTFYNYNYEQPKVFNIKLTASSENECSATYEDQVTVYPKPLAVIVPDIDRNCSPFNVDLDNASQGTALSYYWDYDDGTGEHFVPSGANQQITLTNTSNTIQTYTVKLRTVTGYACSDTVEQPIIVYPEVRASFTPDVTEGCSPIEINFTNTSSPVSTDGATVFEWNFGDAITSTNKNVMHRYVNESGDDQQFVVSLYAASVHGCDSSITDTLTVYISPNAEFIVRDPIMTYPDTVFEFRNVAKEGPWSYWWNYGDGHSSTEDSRDWFTHAYEKWGPKANNFIDTVRFLIYSDHCSDESYQLITRRPPLPYIDIQNEAVRGCVPLAVDFSIVSEFGYEESIEWSFGDGDYTVEPEPYHLFDAPGIYFVRVEIKGDGGIFIDTAQIDVYPLPVPRFTITPTYVMLPDQEVQFYNTSFINWSNSELFYLWDFGDGSSSTEKHPIYLYSVENLDGYPIKLVVTSDKGCMDSLTHDTRVIVDGSGGIDFPNAFLPVDGKMDGTYSELSDEVFRPKHYGVRDYELWIFNRWGEQVFYSDDILVGWNGRYGNNGKMLEQDVYFWKAKGKFNNGAPFKKAGDLTLIRR